MDRDNTHETAYWVEDIAIGAPHVASRWDSHEPSPGDHYPKFMTASPMPHHYGMPQTPAGLPYRGHLQPFQGSDASSTISPASTAGRIPTDGEHYHEDTANASPEDDDDIEEIPFDSTHSELASYDPPFHRLVLDTRGADVQDFGQWYFVSQMPAKDLEFFSSAQDHWVKALWEMARVNQPMYAIMGSFALHKKAVFSKQANTQYLEQKGRVIQDIVANIQTTQVAARSAPDPLTVVAIAILGFLDIRDGQFEAAATHLRAVCKFIDMPSLSSHAWLYIAWIDLRFALFTGSEPQTPFYIPANYRELPASVLSCQHEANRLGSINAANCPRSPLFTLDMACDLYRKLHALCYCSDTLATGEVPPFGQIYALEYGLRVVQARAARSTGDALPRMSWCFSHLQSSCTCGWLLASGRHNAKKAIWR